MIKPSKTIFAGARTKTRGFTLLELMIALAILVVLVGVGVPGFREVTLNTRQATDFSTITSALASARAEAVARNVDVRLCTSSDSANCSNGPVDPSWESGWIIVESTSNTLILVGQPLRGSTTLRSSVFPSVGRIDFLSNGMLQDRGTLRLCDSRGLADIRVINVSLAGQARVGVDEDGNGTIDDVSGGEVNACI